MRYPIWKKDDYFSFLDGTVINMMANVVRLPERAPLTWQFDWRRLPCGEVTDIRLEDDEITGEVTFWEEGWTDETMEAMGLRLGGYFTGVEKNEAGDRVLECDLRGVSILSKYEEPAMPRERPDYEEIDPT